ncbi:MAG: hypothetical protein DLD55_01740 [candidate division SR1 bacterium]|nr:MAG: hypothetical protein DLD55_01740 [candidate division SR1 bacterium]
MNYNAGKKIWGNMTPEQREQAMQQMKNDPKFQGFAQQYAEEYTTQMAQPNQSVPTPPSPQPPQAQFPQQTNYRYGDTGGAQYTQNYQGEGVGSGGGYEYNPKLQSNQLSKGLFFGDSAKSAERRSPGYLEMRNNGIANALYNEGKTDEASIRNYLSTFADFRNYDQLDQDNTVQAISKRMGWMQSQNPQRNQQSQGMEQGGQILGNSTYPQDFWEATRKELQEKFGFSSLEEVQKRYPEEYEHLINNLRRIEGVWNATDPQSRKLLEGHLQNVLGVGTGIGADRSRTKVLEEAIQNKFENPEQIKSDAERVINLQSRGISTAEIASQMGISEDQVQQLVLLANGQQSRAGEYYKLKKIEADKITEPFDERIKKEEEEKNIALERSNRDLEWRKQDFDTNYERQKQINEQNLSNARKLAGKYGYAFSSGAIEGLNNIEDQAKSILDDIVKNYDRGNKQIADGINDIMRNWQWNDKQLRKASQEALNTAKNNFTSGMLQVQQKYGILGAQAQQMFANAVQGFVTQAINIYKTMKEEKQKDLTNLINNISNLNALSVQQTAIRNEKIKQFQAESMHMNREEIASLADELGVVGSYQKLKGYQVQASSNVLNGYAQGAGMVFQPALEKMIDQGYTPQQAISAIVQSQDFAQYKNNIDSKGDNWAMSNGVLYNKATGEVKQAGGGNSKLQSFKEGDLIYDAYGNYIGKAGEGNYGTQSQSGNIEASLQNFVAQNPIGSNGGQCGAFVNDYLEGLGGKRIFTDPITNKKSHINSNVPQVGAIAIMNSPKYPQYGHTAIITAVHEDGSITTIESNRNNDKKVFTRTFKPNMSSNTHVYGYHVPQIKGSETNKQTESLMERNRDTFEQYLDKGPSALGGTGGERLNTIKELGYKSMAGFNKDYNEWLKVKIEEPNPLLLASLDSILNNPLFDYKDEKGKRHNGLLGEQGWLDSDFIGTIESNIAKGEKWDNGLLWSKIANMGDYSNIKSFVNALETIRASKVVDIVKSGKIKLYPMSDADINLLANSSGIGLQAFADKNMTSKIMKALANMREGLNNKNPQGKGLL